MCLSLPGEVVTVDGALAQVRTLGVTRSCNALMYPELRVGDRVLVHGGFVVTVLTVTEASEIEAAFAELGFMPN